MSRNSVTVAIFRLLGFTVGLMFEITESYAPINVKGGGSGICGVFDHQLHPTLGILISIFAPSWGNLNRMTFIDIVFIAIYCKMVGYLTNIYWPTVGHLIENLLKKSNAPHMPDPPPLGLNIDRCIRIKIKVRVRVRT